MSRFKERTYPNEASRQRAERTRARLREADREAAPMFFLQMAEADLVEQGLLDPDKDEYLVGLKLEDGKLVGIVSMPSVKVK